MIKGLVPVEEAQQVVLNHVQLLDTEVVDVIEAVGRVAAEDLRTDIDLSPFDNTAMDGFGVRAADIADASKDNPVALKIIAHIGAGYTYEQSVGAGEAVRIMTGAAMPEGADTVVQVEHVTCTGEGTVGDDVIITAPLPLGKNVRKAAEEAHKGDVVVPAGTLINPAAVGMLASAGHSSISVYRRPTVGIISLGTELVNADTVPAPGQIRNSNSYSLAADVIAVGGIPHVYPIVEDDEKAIEALVKQACEENDFALSSGGASGGDYDYISKAAENLGDLQFIAVCMKPGKSQTFAVIDGTPFIGLAGNPTAAEVGFEMLARPALLKMQGHSHLFRPRQTAKLAAPVTRKGNRRWYLRGSLKRDEAGELIAVTDENQSSALLGPLAHGNCLITIPLEATRVEAGDEVECVRLDMPEGTLL